MKERPILFSAPMVRALLAGTKTQTRRIVKQQLMPDVEFVREHAPDAYGPGAFCAFRQDGRVLMHQRMAPCPYGQPGDRLAVRETWRYCDWTEDGLPWVEFQADGARCLCENGISEEWADKLGDIWADLSAPQNFELDGRAADRRWRQSIHMPRWASRITLEITGVRVERLHDISEADAIAEGIVKLADGGYGLPDGSHYHATDPRISYLSLWGAINGQESVDANPFVWVIEFKRLEHGAP